MYQVMRNKKKYLKLSTAAFKTATQLLTYSHSRKTSSLNKNLILELEEQDRPIKTYETKRHLRYLLNEFSSTVLSA